MHYSGLIDKAFAVFAEMVAKAPSISLRAGNSIDEYGTPPPFDSTIDRPTDEYIETYWWGVSHLDQKSWQHYLPALIAYSCRHIDKSSLVIDALLSSLRPPDHEPPHLASLSPEQEKVIIQFLDILAFNPASAHQEYACQVLEEWWIPGALYRTAPT